LSRKSYDPIILYDPAGFLQDPAGFFHARASCMNS
jgi:hypothetical protein